MKDWQKVFLRAAGVAAGATIALAAIALALYWRAELPKQWSEKAVTAQLNALIFQQVGEGIHFTIRYALTNATDHDYVLPKAAATLMSKSTENGALSRLEGATWPTDLTIPAKQRVEVGFVVPYEFADYNTSAEELYGEKGAGSGGDGKPLDASKELMKFVGDRLKQINGLVFFDFVNRYKIVLPDPKDIPKPKKP
jgi:hypothetical protein